MTAAPRALALAALAALAAGPACSGSKAPPAPAPPETPAAAPAAPESFDPAAIDAWLAGELAARGVVGAAVVVVRDGATVLARGYGTRVAGTVAPIDADTPFAIGSVTKQMTCAAVLALADDGKLALTDPVAAYFPEATAAAELTLADLGGHVAGYRDYYPLDYIDARMRAPIDPDELIRRYAGLPLDFAPRERYSYSNTGFVMLARIVERVAGVPLARFLAERFWAPLGMTRTSAGPPPPGAALGHEAFLLGPPRPSPVEAAGWLLGAGDVWASAADLARWDLGLATGAILGDASRRALTTPLRTRDGRTTHYGCGIAERVVRRETVLAHSGWVTGSVAYNAIVPRTRTAIVLLANDQHADVGDLHDRLVRLALDDTFVPAVRGVPAGEAARALIVQLQRGALDRAQLGADLDAYLDPARVAEAAPRLRALGEPRVAVRSQRERGGLEVSELDLEFPTRTVRATMFRAPDGKIHQLSLTP